MSGKALSLMVVTLALLGGCSKKTDYAEDINRRSDTAPSDTSAHHQFLLSAERRLADYDARIDTLRAKLAVADARARVRIQENLNQLDEQRRKAQVRLDELRAASVDTWERTRLGFVESLDSLDARFDRARARMR